MPIDMLDFLHRLAAVTVRVLLTVESYADRAEDLRWRRVLHSQEPYVED